MSDFGTLLFAKKLNGNNISENEMNSLSNSLKDIIDENEYSDALGEPFNHEFGTTDGNEVIVQLSEHYYGNEDPDEMKEFVKETELEQAKKLKEKMKSKFSAYNFEVSIEEW
jgi:hypothetical protein